MRAVPPPDSVAAERSIYVVAPCRCAGSTGME
jgi:hypothetical protein